MPPVRRDICQRKQHKGAFRQAGVRQGGIGHRAAVVIQEVEIQGAIGVRMPPLTSERPFDFMQMSQQLRGRQFGLDRRDGIRKPWLAGVGYRRVRQRRENAATRTGATSSLAFAATTACRGGPAMPGRLEPSPIKIMTSCS